MADHDFSKLSIIPDGILVHKIPENDEEVQDGDGDSLNSIRMLSKGQWYNGTKVTPFTVLSLWVSKAAQLSVESSK